MDEEGALLPLDTPLAPPRNFLAGPHTRRVASSLAETRTLGYTGFQETQFTVRLWPDRIWNEEKHH